MILFAEVIALQQSHGQRANWVHSQSVVMQLGAQLHDWIEVVALAE